jgi:hypothetical protein
MRKFRMYGAALSVVALLGATAAVGGTASAATPTGVGTTRATTTLLNVALGTDGSLLNVRLVGDDGTANIDPKQGTPAAASSALTPLAISSSIGQLNGLTVPGKQSVSSTGAADNKTIQNIDLTTPLTTGSISPLSLSAVVDSTQGAASGLTSTLKNVTAVAGLLSVPSATSNLGAAAKPADADGLRGASIPSIQVLNLGAVLQGLGINSATLTLDQVGSVINALGGNGAPLVAQVTSVVTTLTNTPVQTPPGIAGLPTATLISALPAPLQAAIAALFPGGTIPSGVTDIAGLITTLNNQITGLLTGALTGITNSPLVQVDQLVVGITTKAADTVANSSSDIQASLADIKVGGVVFQGADVAALVGQANTQITSVLNAVGLGSLIQVKALDQSKSVGTQTGYTNALANLTGVHVAIAPLPTPPTAPAVNSPTLGSLYTLAGGGTPPVLSQAMATLSGLPGMPAVGALASGATVDVLAVGAASTFVPTSGSTANPAAPSAPTGTLATTGGPTQLLGFIGLLLLATVAGLRWLRRPVTTD